MNGILCENFTTPADVPSDDAIWPVGSRPPHVLIRSVSNRPSNAVIVVYLVQLIRFVVIPCVLMFVSSQLWSVYNTCLRDVINDKPLPPGGYGLPVIGETLNFIIMGRSFFDRKRKKHGNVFKTHILGKPTVRVIGSDNVKQILRGENTLVTTQWPRSTCILLGEGCISHATGSSHTAKKKALMKSFSYSALSSYVPTIQEVTRKYIGKWCRQEHIMGCDELKKMNFDVASRVLVGFEMDGDELENLIGVFETFLSNLFCLPVNIPGLGLWKGLRARDKILEKIESEIRMKQAKDNPTDHALVNFLLNNDTGKETLTLPEIKNLCLELLFAGHETTSSACSTLVLQLARSPDIRRKIKEELNGLGLEAPGCGDDLDFQLLKRMTYVNNVVREALRLVPPIGGGCRKALRTFEIDGYQIPKDWCVTYSIRDTHETTDMFKNVDQFDPDRWNNSCYSSNSYQYLPFGGGKRACAGKDLAQLMLKIFTVELVRCSSWTVANPNVSISGFPVPYPKDNLPCVFKSVSESVL